MVVSYAKEMAAAELQHTRHLVSGGPSKCQAYVHVPDPEVAAS